MRNKIVLGAVMAASLMALGTAQAQYTAIVSVAPPAPQYEVVPAPRRGYVWAPGHYEYRGNQYVWVQGRWLAEREGYAYDAPRWVQRGNGEWMLVGGDWQRRGPNGDRDGDGVSNRDERLAREARRADRFGPYGDLDRDGIMNQDDRDRDGDGIRNRNDRFPDDRRRS
jgi:hypothetical protein